MTRRRLITVAAVLALLTGLTVAAVVVYRHTFDLDRSDRRTPEAQRQQILALEAERAGLRDRLERLVGTDPALVGMPDTPVRIAVPTSLARDLVERVMAGVADNVTLQLRNIRVRKTGTVRRVVTLGTYDLKVTIDRVEARLQAGTPRLTFGGNRVAVGLPLTVASGTGSATVDFLWDGRTIGGAVCGDMHVVQTVTGTVVPRHYSLNGALHLQATDTVIRVQPRLPRLRMHIDINPSAGSWAAAQKVLDDRRGLCGFVIDRIDIMGAVRGLIAKGFNVRLPTEKLTAIALPVAVEPTLLVRGEPVALGIRVGDLTITEHAIWLGTYVTVAVGDDAALAVTRGRAPQ